MARSFSLVEAKVAEADFFLGQLDQAGTDFFAARCYFSAFVASVRSVTYALQAVMSDVPGFPEWYAQEQFELVNDPVCRFFHHARRLDHHVGLNSLSGGAVAQDELGQMRVIYDLSHELPSEGLPKPPDVDALSACHTYFNTVLKVVFDCCSEFSVAIDPKVWFTKENFDEMGLTISDAEEELYGVSGWTAAPGVTEDRRWQLIRDSVWGSGLQSLFERHLAAAGESH